MRQPTLSDDDKSTLAAADRIATIQAVHARHGAEIATDPIEAERLTCEADAGCSVMHGVQVLLGLPRSPTFVDKYGRPMATYIGMVLRREEVEILRRVLEPHAESPVVARVLAALAADEVQT